MYKKALYVFFALLLVGIIFGPQSAQATASFPNTDTYSAYTFSLDMEGNGELVTIIRYVILDDNFEWRSETPLEIPMQITSFSKEKANLTEVSVGDNYNLKSSIRNYTISPPQSDSTYVHEYVIEVSPKSGYFHFLKNQIVTIRTKTKINQISSTVGDYGKFVYYIPKNFQYFSNSFIQSFIIRVNLPNDPYYWDEILDTFPKYDYRTSFGRGESVEWYYKPNSNWMSPIIINFKIHPDPIKLDLDKATMKSLEYAKKADFWGFIALIIAIISIPGIYSRGQALIGKFKEWIMEKWKNRP